jgi:hypothetical protein
MSTLLADILKRIEDKQAIEPSDDLSPKGMFGDAPEGDKGLPADRNNEDRAGDKLKTEEQDLPARATTGQITGSGNGQEL